MELCRVPFRIVVKGTQLSFRLFLKYRLTTRHNIYQAYDYYLTPLINLSEPLRGQRARHTINTTANNHPAPAYSNLVIVDTGQDTHEQFTGQSDATRIRHFKRASILIREELRLQIVVNESIFPTIGE